MVHDRHSRNGAGAQPARKYIYAAPRQSATLRAAQQCTQRRRSTLHWAGDEHLDAAARSRDSRARPGARGRPRRSHPVARALAAGGPARRRGRARCRLRRASSASARASWPVGTFCRCGRRAAHPESRRRPDRQWARAQPANSSATGERRPRAPSCLSAASFILLPSTMPRRRRVVHASTSVRLGAPPRASMKPSALLPEATASAGRRRAPGLFRLAPRRREVERRMQ